MTDSSEGAVTLVGQLVDASNAVFLVEADGALAIYKPVRGERPLWDFPDGTLAGREVAAYLVSRAGGFDLVPETTLREGPFGPGSVQRWVTADPRTHESHDDGEDEWVTDGEPHGAVDARDAGGDDEPDDDEPDEGGPDDEPGDAAADALDPVDEDSLEDVVLAAPDGVPPGYRVVLHGETEDGSAVVVAHGTSPELTSAAVFDALVNNSDRKGSHLLRADDGRLWCVDHGVALHRDDKLRTVLWGWAGEEIPVADLERVARVVRALDDDSSELSAGLTGLVTPAEVAALRSRARRLLTSRRFPEPSEDWPSVPWPPL